MSSPGSVASEQAPPIVSNDPGSYPHSVLRDRHPALIRQARATFPYPPKAQRALDELLEEITGGVIQPLPESAHDHAAWRRWGAGCFGRSWYDVPFLWAESYFYRRLLHAVDYYADGPWRGIDLFEPQKSAELTTVDLDELDGLAELAEPQRREAVLRAAVWGNRADLGFRMSDSGSAYRDQEADLVADDSELLWRRLDGSPGGTVCVVADNAGPELLPDLVLVDHLLETGRADRVDVHLKPAPYYVSDALAADLLACLRRLTGVSGDAAAIGGRLWKALTDGRLTVTAHPFYCAPLEFRHLPADLAAGFAAAKITIMKGDLNHRRLVGDRHWPATVPFREVTAYFPGSVATLRTLKSDVVVGVDARTVAALDAADGKWRIRGTRALIQVKL